MTKGPTSAEAASVIRALRNSHDALAALVEPLSVEQLEQPSYAAEWSIAQVCSHLGSQAEIFNLSLDAGLSGQPAPGADAFTPIWDIWNAKSAQAQATDAVRSDNVVVDRFESLAAAPPEHWHLDLFGRDLDLSALARMRLGELALHAWDIAVSLNPTATVAPDAVDLLVDTLGELVSRVGKPGGLRCRVAVATTGPDRYFGLDVGETVELLSGETAEHSSELRLPAECLVRLVYGRLSDVDVPLVRLSGNAPSLDELRAIFPGV
ncbi:MAG TPA: maleylpyruvate isomerase family mycothiol-dependent enzyme [Acidimicrobiales bacterium]|nr:maleylpyruvate isomerase family mycothiol-dependent enzyme [Acidimicrobiales bacterium]